MEWGGAAYIITNRHDTVLYTGSTVDLLHRLGQHRDRLDKRAFSYRYNLYKLVYFEGFHRIEEARAREYFIKGKSRKWKLDLITKFNPTWRDLFDEII